MALLFRIPFRLFTLVLIAGGAGLLFSLAVVRVLDSADIKAPRTTLDVLGTWQHRLGKVRRLHAVAYLGDSTALSDKGYKYTIPGRLDAELKKQDDPPRLISLADAGLGPIDYYLLASELARAEPAAIVVSLNLASLSSVWLSRSSHPEFASVIGLERWPEAFGLPLAASGLTADRLLLYPWLQAMGLSSSWRHLVDYQARVLAGWRALESRLDGAYGPLATNRLAVFARATSEKNTEGALRLMQRARYGKVIEGLDSRDPSLQVLTLALRDWHSAGIPVLLLIIPVNVELFESLGIAKAEGLRQTSRSLAEIAQTTGAHFLDLHDLLPAASFADAYGHFVQGADPDGANRIAKRLAPIVEAMVRGQH